MSPKVKITHSPDSGIGLARAAALAALDKKAEDIVIIDLCDIESAPADFFMICTCNSTTHAQAVASSVETECRVLATQPPRSEGWDALEWVIVDCFDVVAHIMTATTRDFYTLEKLWGDGKFTRLNENGEFIADKKPSRKRKSTKGAVEND